MPKNDLKVSISRSHSRKVNLGNYQSADFFSSRSMEFPANIDEQELEQWSVKLAEQAKKDVDLAIIKFQSDALKSTPNFDQTLKQTPAPWRQFKKPEIYQKKSRVPVVQQEEDFGQVPPDEELLLNLE